LSTINIEIEEIFYISSILSETANLPSQVKLPLAVVFVQSV